MSGVSGVLRCGLKKDFVVLLTAEVVAACCQ
jgi:hypothetical protein